MSKEKSDDSQPDSPQETHTSFLDALLKPKGRDPQAEAVEGFKKFDSAKIRFDLLPIPALEDIALVLQYGAEKYGDYNYLNGFNNEPERTFVRYYAAALRHLFASAKGQPYDEESGLPHLAHACACIMIMMHGTYEEPTPEETVS